MKEINYKEWQKNPKPREMWVWNNEVEEKKKERVIAVLGQKNIKHRILAIQGDYEYIKRFNHCAEIEEQKTRPKTYKELAWWLQDGIKAGKHREWKLELEIDATIRSTMNYSEEQANDFVKNILVRENGGEWHKPIIEL